MVVTSTKLKDEDLAKELEKRIEEKVQRAILRKIWKFVEFKAPENWHRTPLGYSCFLPQGYICYFGYFGQRYNIRLHKHDVTFFDFDFDGSDAQNSNFLALYERLDAYFQEKFAKEKEKLLARFLRENNRIGKHVKHDDRPMRRIKK